MVCVRQGCIKRVSKLGPTLIVVAPQLVLEVGLCDDDATIAADLERRRYLVEIGTERAGRSLDQVLEDLELGGRPIPGKVLELPVRT
jgi:hypothetical protein